MAGLLRDFVGAVVRGALSEATRSSRSRRRRVRRKTSVTGVIGSALQKAIVSAVTGKTPTRSRRTKTARLAKRVLKRRRDRS